MPTTTNQSARPSDQFLAVLRDFEQALVIMHDNPDPDAIAAGWSVLRLVQERLHMPARLVGGGAIVRAENKQMVKLLAPPIQLVNELVLEEGVATILVDCGLGTTNHLATRAAVDPVAVIDHHLHSSLGICRVLCAAIIEQDLLLSARTARDSANAAFLLEKTLDGWGGCGGHIHRAGGKVAQVEQRGISLEDLYDQLRARWLHTCGVDLERGTRLVARRDIVDNLCSS